MHNRGDRGSRAADTHENGRETLAGRSKPRCSSEKIEWRRGLQQRFLSFF